VQKCYRGAVPNTGSGEVNWLQGGWLCLEDFGDCASAAPGAVTFWSGTYGPGGTHPGTSFTMDAAHSHLLQGKVTILAGATLTIQAGTFVFGENASSGYLAINRDADIIANGTISSPIVMTTDLVNPTPGGWGGLVIHGKAIANCADCLGGASCVSEGGAGSFCGTDDCDNSGSLRYVRCQFSGIELSTDNELNSFTFNAVGNGTSAQYLQAHRGSDDSFEWFGGAMNASYLYSSGNQDDGLDFQMGFRGTVQNAVVVAYDGSDKAIEGDNNEFGFDHACRSNPLFPNLTLIGPATPADGVGGIHLRRGADASIFNSIIYSASGPGLRLQHAETCARGAHPYPAGNPACNSSVDAPTVFAGGSKEIEVRAYPNPVANETQFAFSLPTSGPVSLALYDVAGREIDRVLETSLEAGPHTVTWAPAANLAAGAYFYRLEGERIAKTGKVMLVK
jgi:hypothetical protein